MPRDSNDGISVNRLGSAPVNLLHKLGRQHGKQRKQNYYGMATVSAKKIRKKSRGVKYKDIKSDITLENPFHANIWLPADTDKDYAILCAHNICEGAEAGFIEDSN